MKFALLWDRFDIAQMFLLTGQEKLKRSELEYLMKLALIYNKPKFVEYFLETGLDLNSFLTKEIYSDLYNNQTVRINLHNNNLLW